MKNTHRGYPSNPAPTNSPSIHPFPVSPNQQPTSSKKKSIQKSPPRPRRPRRCRLPRPPPRNRTVLHPSNLLHPPPLPRRPGSSTFLLLLLARREEPPSDFPPHALPPRQRVWVLVPQLRHLQEVLGVTGVVVGAIAIVPGGEGVECGGRPFLFRHRRSRRRRRCRLVEVRSGGREGGCGGARQLDGGAHAVGVGGVDAAGAAEVVVVGAGVGRGASEQLAFAPDPRGWVCGCGGVGLGQGAGVLVVEEEGGDGGGEGGGLGWGFGWGFGGFGRGRGGFWRREVGGDFLEWGGVVGCGLRSGLWYIEDGLEGFFFFVVVGSRRVVVRFWVLMPCGLLACAHWAGFGSSDCIVLDVLWRLVGVADEFRPCTVLALVCGVVDRPVLSFVGFWQRTGPVRLHEVSTESSQLARPDAIPKPICCDRRDIPVLSVTQLFMPWHHLIADQNGSSRREFFIICCAHKLDCLGHME